MGSKGLGAEWIHEHGEWYGAAEEVVYSQPQYASSLGSTLILASSSPSMTNASSSTLTTYCGRTHPTPESPSAGLGSCGARSCLSAEVGEVGDEEAEADGGTQALAAAQSKNAKVFPSFIFSSMGRMTRSSYAAKKSIVSHSSKLNVKSQHALFASSSTLSLHSSLGRPMMKRTTTISVVFTQPSSPSLNLRSNGPSLHRPLLAQWLAQLSRICCLLS